MKIFKRLRDLTMATIHDLLDKAEDPVKMLNQFLRDMAEDLKEAENAVAGQIAMEKRLKLQYQEAEQMVVKREEQAMQALKSGNEELARKVLGDKKEHQERCEALKQQYETATKNTIRLRDQLKEMKEQYNTMKNKRELLINRAETATAEKRIQKSMSSFGSEHASTGFGRMSEKVSRMEIEAEVAREIRVTNQSLDDELRDLNKQDTIEAELAELKAKLADKSS